MNIHEYQAKDLYRQYGIATAIGYPAFTVDEAVEAARKLPGPVWVVKSQIHAGGRGKGKFKEASAGTAGGVRLAKSMEEVKTFAEQMLNATLVTIQTGEAGRVVKRLYVEDGSQIDRELYLSALVDRATSRISFIVSTTSLYPRANRAGLSGSPCCTPSAESTQCTLQSLENTDNFGYCPASCVIGYRASKYRSMS